MKVWINTEGEVFEGSKNALIKEKGIKQKNGFSRPSGALDKDGNRWLSEEAYKAQGGIKKQILYIGDRYVDGCIVSPSEIAGNYIAAKNVVENDPNHPHYYDYVELMKTVEGQYEVVVPTVRIKEPVKKLASRTVRIEHLLNKHEDMSFDEALDLVLRSEARAIANGYVVSN